MSKTTHHPPWRTQSPIRAETHMHGHHIAPSKDVVRSVRGTGKSQATSPSHTHKANGAIKSPKKAHGPLDNRGKDNDRKRMR
jgi:hypothetical protein